MLAISDFLFWVYSRALQKKDGFPWMGAGDIFIH
jgi:hypothetical protein